MKLKMDDQPRADREGDVSFDIDAVRLKLAQHFNREFPAQPPERRAAAKAAKRKRPPE
jgi:hypothetical protein